MRGELVRQFSDEQMDKVDVVIDTYRNISGALLIALEKTQDITLYLPVNLQRYIAKRMGVKPSKVAGVVTFYSYFSTVPRGRKVIKVCSGTACYVKRSGEIMDRLKQKVGICEGEVTADGEYSIEEVRCLGACGLAPVVVVGEDTFGLIDPEHVEEIIEKP
jgi:NADH:ubiquinone oxidoreductase subunit E